MTRPTPAQIEALLDQCVIPIKAPKGHLDRKRIARVLTEAFDRDRYSTKADGYPSSTEGGFGGGSTLTSVEAAVERRAFSKQERDIIRENVEQAWGYLDQAVASIHALEGRIGNLVKLMGSLDDPIPCAVLKSENSHCFSTVGGRLPDKMHLSKPVYDFVFTWDRLPTVDERHEYETSGKWRIRVSNSRNHA